MIKWTNWQLLSKQTYMLKCLRGPGPTRGGLGFLEMKNFAKKVGAKL